MTQKLSNVKLYALAFSGSQSSEMPASLMNRVTVIDQKGIYGLEKSCQEYFICSSLFSTSVILSKWTVGLSVPYHSRSLFGAFESWSGHKHHAREGSQSTRNLQIMQSFLFPGKDKRRCSYMNICPLSGLGNKTHIW